MRPAHRARRSVLAAAGSLLVLSGLLPVAAAPAVLGATPVFINEIHYDNASTDTAEAIEVAGPAETDLSGWDIVLYNGTGGAPYGTLSLSGTIGNLQNGFGTASVSAVGLQNGSPDGIALVNGTTVVQFLSYEGTFAAVGGPADGMTSTDIGVLEAGTETAGLSIGLTGTGTAYEDFAWTTGLDDSFGDPNPGQTFDTAETPDPVINEFSASTAGTDVEYLELLGEPVTNLSAFRVLEIEGDAGTSLGTVDEVVVPGTTNGGGLWLGNLDANALENGTITLLLVREFTGALGGDLDTNNDGVFDSTPWAEIVDAVGVNDGGTGDLTYGVPSLGVSYDGAPFAPGGASRIPDGTDTDATGDWVRNDFDLVGIPGFAGTPAEGEAENTPGAPNKRATVPPPAIVINEIDYDQAGTDAAEFIELKNTGSTTANLADITVDFINGGLTPPASYRTVTLSGSLAAGDYIVICGNAANTANCDVDHAVNTDLIQNGAPDAVAVLHKGVVIDKVSYEGNTTGYTEGSGVGLIDDGVLVTGIARCADGADTDQNNVDFAQRPITPGAPNDCAVGTRVTVSDVSGVEGDSGSSEFSFTVSLSQAAPVGGVTFDIATADNTATTANADYVARSLTGQTIPQGASTYTFSVTVNGDAVAEPDESFFVNVTNVVGATVGDGQGVGTIVNDEAVVTFIHDIQRSGATSAAGTFTIDGIVVGDYQTQGSGQLRGFFVQEENGDVDADPNTSEGIFVFCSTCPVAVAVGDRVRVTGASSEFNDMTQLTGSTASSVAVVSTANPLPSAAPIELPVPGVPTNDMVAARAAINAYFERSEGMLVAFPDTLSVSEYFEIARYGHVILREGGRPHTYTAANTPTASGFVANQIDLATRAVILDDTDNRENRATDVPNTPYYHPVPGLSTSNFFRGGDTITNLTGVLHWSFAGGGSANTWRIRPVTEAYNYAFTPVNTRPAMPDIDGSLTVASFNVLNYFLTVDNNTCAPTQNQDCRGADSVEELSRQRTKMLEALKKIDADVFGFMEMENTPGVEPLADIVAGLPGYDYIDTGVIGTDAIRVGIIYKAATVRPVGDFAILDSTVDPRFVDTRNRPALAQAFEETATGGRVTVVVNHLKSKGSGCGPGDDDTTTGQGNCNGTRTLAAEALADWLATDPTGSGDSDVLIIGDLNSYAMEDPIVALQNAGYTDLVAQFGGPGAYGYVFDGQLGYLDHALANGSLQPQVTDVAEWHINADEIPLFDYNDDARTADEAAFEEESDSLPLYEPNEFRTSDHDPVIVGLDLGNDAPVADSQSMSTDEDTSTSVTLTASDGDSASLTYTVVSGPAHGTLTGTAPNLTYTPHADFHGTDSFTFKANDGYSDSNVATVTITVTPVQDAPVAVDDSATTGKGTAVFVDVLANDFDVDGDSLTITSWTKGANGAVRLVDGTLRYGPREGFRGTDTFTYTISDGNGGTDTATVTVTVTK